MQWQQISFLALERQAELRREADRERTARLARRERPRGRVGVLRARSGLLAHRQAIQPCAEG